MRAVERNKKEAKKINAEKNRTIKKNAHDEFQEGRLNTYITLDKNEHAIYGKCNLFEKH